MGFLFFFYYYFFILFSDPAWGLSPMERWGPRWAGAGAERVQWGGRALGKRARERTLA